MSHQVHIGHHTGFFRSPLGIAALTIAASFGGGWLKDRLTIEGRETTTAVKVEALDIRVTEQLSNIREDLRDIKKELSGRK